MLLTELMFSTNPSNIIGIINPKTAPINTKNDDADEANNAENAKKDIKKK